ncbi:MAG: GNAT family N-acetyltransferase [Saprospiraceae bacterium]
MSTLPFFHSAIFKTFPPLPGALEPRDEFRHKLILCAANDPTGNWYRPLLVVHDNEIIGNGGFKGPPDVLGRVEIGYTLAPAARGRGFGTELVRLLIGKARTQGAMQLIAHVLPDNAASIRVLEKNGFLPAGEIELGNQRLLRYACH